MAHHVSSGTCCFWMAFLHPRQRTPLHLGRRRAIPVESAATPRKGTLLTRSSKHPMQKPTVRVHAFTEYPQLHAIDVKNRVVIASDFTSVPPTCFNPFNIAKKS